MFDDEKIKLIEKMPDADTLLIIWIKLICQAGKINDLGSIYLTPDMPYNDENLATVFNRPINVVRLALDTFKKLRMIEIGETGTILLVNWEKHQNLDALERIREDTRKRVQSYRVRQKQLTLGNVTVTCRNDAEEEEEEEKNRTEKEKKKEVLLKLIEEKRYNEVTIGSETLASIIRCLKGEQPCLPANLNLYKTQLKKLGIDLQTIGIEE
jgi:predicted phage replisome organizer